MTEARKIGLALAVCAGVALCVPSARAQESSDDETGFRFTIDGAFTWMGTRGNDVGVGEIVTIDESFDRENGSMMFEEIGSALVTEMRNRGVPWTQVGFEKGKWGVAAEFWTLDTDGSSTTGDPTFDGFRYHDVAGTLDGSLVDLEAANALSVWSARLMLLRAVSKSLTFGVGLQTAKLENRRDETLNISDSSFIFIDLGARVETRSKTVGTLIGPSFDLRGSASLGGRATVRFTAAESVLFATFENESLWQSAVTFGELFFFPISTQERFSLDSSTRVAIPVTDARALVSYDFGSHVSVGVLGLLSVWVDAPLALEFSQATGGWDPVRSTLVFASVGPIVSVRF